MSESSALSLLVIAGTQRGARVTLNQGRYKVGNTFDCDIIIQDSAIDDESVLITVAEEQILINTVVNREMQWSDKKTDNQSIPLALYTPYQLGTTAFIVGYSDSMEWQDFLQSEDTAILHVDQHEQILETVHRSHNYKLASFSVLTIAVIALAVFAVNLITQKDTSDSPQAQLVKIRTTLDSKGYASIDAVAENQRILLSGFVDEYSDAIKLQEIVQQTGINAVIDLEIGSKLAADVRNVFRTNGVLIDVIEVSDAGVKIKTNNTNVLKLEAVKKVALRDIDGLLTLAIDYATVADDLDNSEFLSGPGKRIITVVQGELSYFVTEDESRYFIGSHLPSGYIVSDISQNLVQLSREGKKYYLPI